MATVEIKKPDLQKHVQQLAKTKKTLVNEMKEPKRKVRSVPIELDYFFKKSVTVTLIEVLSKHR